MKTKFYSMITAAVIAALMVPVSVATARSAFSISVDLGNVAWGVSSYRSHSYVTTQVAVPVYAPQPVYYAPQPLVYAPQPVYYAPQPVVYAPPPVVYVQPPRYVHYAPPPVVHYAHSIYGHHRAPPPRYCAPPQPPRHGSHHGRRR